MLAIVTQLAYFRTKFGPRWVWLCLSLTRLPLIKHHRLGNLNNRKLSSHSSRGWKSKLRVSASDADSPPGYRQHPSLLSSGREVSLFLFLRLSVSFDQDSSLMTSFNHNYLLKALSSHRTTLGVRTSTHALGRDTNIPFITGSKKMWRCALGITK